MSDKKDIEGISTAVQPIYDDGGSGSGEKAVAGDDSFGMSLAFPLAIPIHT